MVYIRLAQLGTYYLPTWLELELGLGLANIHLQGQILLGLFRCNQLPSNIHREPETLYPDTWHLHLPPHQTDHNNLMQPISDIQQQKNLLRQGSHCFLYRLHILEIAQAVRDQEFRHHTDHTHQF